MKKYNYEEYLKAFAPKKYYEEFLKAKREQDTRKLVERLIKEVTRKND